MCKLTGARLRHCRRIRGKDQVQGGNLFRGGALRDRQEEFRQDLLALLNKMDEKEKAEKETARDNENQNGGQEQCEMMWDIRQLLENKSSMNLREELRKILLKADARANGSGKPQNAGMGRDKSLIT